MDSSESVDLASSLNDAASSCYRKSLFGSTSNLQGDITSVNHSLVKDGWCWWYRKYAPVIRSWTGGENEACEGAERLWADPAHVPLWEGRKRTS